MAWSYDDLPGRVAEAVGAAPREKLQPPGGGEGPILLLDNVANRIADGEIEIALLAGADCVYSRRRARAESRTLDWAPGGAGRPRFLLDMKPFANALEARHGVRDPVDMYPLYENALRKRAGRSIEAHQRFVSELMARYSAVAVTNPYSWFPEPRTAEEIRTVTPKNRWIGFPYPKLVNALMEVDQAAAVIAMSESAADRLGIPPAKRVAFLGGASANDGWSAAERVDLASSPAMAAIARATQAHAGLGVADVDLFDFYSCFPCVVEFALDALGLSPSDPRPPTQTGGLAHHGGPGNNYAMHGLANTVSHSARSQGQGGVGHGSRHERHQACGGRALERPRAHRRVRRARDATHAARRVVRWPQARRCAERTRRDRELHRHVRSRQQARAEHPVFAARRRPSQRRARREHSRAVPPLARGRRRRPARHGNRRPGRVTQHVEAWLFARAPLPAARRASPRPSRPGRRHPGARRYARRDR